MVRDQNAWITVIENGDLEGAIIRACLNYITRCDQEPNRISSSDGSDFDEFKVFVDGHILTLKFNQDKNQAPRTVAVYRVEESING